ncbi:MAG TPA: class I SAM-dependent methyltransferase [Rhabdochlamydiaceae bacterium]|nr:class I SAM-dependent methyltransferase [Rhabdochlamydiaceae bacterium]
MSQFSVFNSHLDLAHQYWQKILQRGDWAIDATCGNGKDSLKLAHLVTDSGGVISLDIQTEALEKARLFTSQQKNIHFFLISHHTFPSLAYTKPIRLIVYNLGYLPGGDKTLTTQAETTLESLKTALSLLMAGGMISITCYPGHDEGAREENILLSFINQLDPSIWNICHHRALNRLKSPSLLIFQKKI